MFRIIMEIKNTLNDLINIRKELNLIVSDECLFENAVKMSISNSIQNSKSYSQKSSHGEPVGKEVGRFSPSLKQVKILSEAGLSKEQINNMSKVEVSKLIGEYLNSLKRENI